MTPSRILPDLQCALVCEQVRREANGNFFIIGVLDHVLVPGIPVTIPPLAVFSRWTAGIGQFQQSVRLVAPDQTTVLQKTDLRFAMKDPAQNATTLVFFTQMELKQAGAYFVEVMVDDVMKLRFPLTVVVVQPQGQQPAQPKPEPPA